MKLPSVELPMSIITSDTFGLDCISNVHLLSADPTIQSQYIVVILLSLSLGGTKNNVFFLNFEGNVFYL